MKINNLIKVVFSFLIASCASEPASPEIVAIIQSRLAVAEIVSRAYEDDGYTPKKLSDDYLVRSPRGERVPLTYVGRIKLNLENREEIVPLVATPFTINGYYFVGYSDGSYSEEKENPIKAD